MVSIKPTEVIVWDNHNSWKVEKKILIRRDTDKATPDSVHKFSPNLWLTPMIQKQGRLLGAWLRIKEPN